MKTLLKVLGVLVLLALLVCFWRIIVVALFVATLLYWWFGPKKVWWK